MKLYHCSPLTLLLVVTSCASRPQPRVTLHPAGSPATAVEAVRYSEVVRPYHIGRYVDPNHPDVMHEQHPLYRVENYARWNLKPGARTTSQVANANALVESAFSPAPLNDAIVAELQRQKEVTERVLREASRLGRSYAELQESLKGMAAVAKSQNSIAGRIADTERQLKLLDDKLRALLPTGGLPAVEMLSPTNALTSPPATNALPVDGPGQTNSLPALH